MAWKPRSEGLFRDKGAQALRTSGQARVSVPLEARGVAEDPRDAGAAADSGRLRHHIKTANGSTDLGSCISITAETTETSKGRRSGCEWGSTLLLAELFERVGFGRDFRLVGN